MHDEADALSVRQFDLDAWHRVFEQPATGKRCHPQLTERRPCQGRLPAGPARIDLQEAAVVQERRGARARIEPLGGEQGLELRRRRAELGLIKGDVP
jgi:hypothetical protein